MVIDANVFKGYYEVDMGRKHTLSGCPQSLICSASPQTPIYMDSKYLVESEWRQVVDYDWFEIWLANNLQSGNVQYLEVAKDLSLEKGLKSQGFPGGHDIVYVRLGLAVTKVKHGSCSFYTEDIDFYDPKHKSSGSKIRLKLITSSGGPIPKLLSKYGIVVECVP